MKSIITDTQHTTCPQCGGVDRFYRIAQPHGGGVPYWRCRQCDYTAPDAGVSVHSQHEAAQRPILSHVDIDTAHYAYGVVAERCKALLWSKAGAHALQYLRHTRGLSDETIKEAGLGYSPDTTSLFTDLWQSDEHAYRGTYLGGLRKRQAVPFPVMREVITIPYWHEGRCVLLRGRKLAPRFGESKYYSPAGPLYASAEPRFYLHHVLRDVSSLLLTEGEFKALVAHQAWRSGLLPMPCVAVCGVSYLPDVLIKQLRGKTVYIAFDNEAPRHGEQLSPAELAIMRHGPRLRKQRVKVNVVTLPRPEGVNKVDLDGYLLTHAARASC